MIKVTIQLKSEEIAIANKKAKALGQPLQPANVSFGGAFKEILSEGGPLGFYRGLSAAFLRQIFYTTTRLGMYKTVVAEVTERNKQQGRSTYLLM